jgi:hypothetical protein
VYRRRTPKPSRPLRPNKFPSERDRECSCCPIEERNMGIYCTLGEQNE